MQFLFCTFSPCIPFTDTASVPTWLSCIPAYRRSPCIHVALLYSYTKIQMLNLPLYILGCPIFLQTNVALYLHGRSVLLHKDTDAKPISAPSWLSCNPTDRCTPVSMWHLHSDHHLYLRDTPAYMYIHMRPSWLPVSLHTYKNRFSCIPTYRRSHYTYGTDTVLGPCSSTEHTDTATE